VNPPTRQIDLGNSVAFIP